MEVVVAIFARFTRFVVGFVKSAMYFAIISAIIVITTIIIIIAKH